MRTPWEKDEQKWRNIPVVTSASDKAINGPKPVDLIFDEMGQSNFHHYNNQLEYKIKSYPDNSKYVVVESMASNLTFRINSYEDLWILNQIHDVVKYADWKVTVTIPNLIDAQADRRFDVDQPHSLKLVCEFLNGLSNFTYKIFHPHNAEVVEALIKNVEIIDSSEYLTRVLNWSSETFVEGKINHIDLKNLVFLLPDGGAYKWGVKLLDKVLKTPKDIVAAAKNRQFIEGHSKLVQQLPDYDFKGKDVMIIDDICIGGGTFKGLAKLLKEKKCGKLYLTVSHLTIENLGDDAVTKYFDKVFTTNSKFDEYWDNTDRSFSVRDNLEIITLF